MTMLAPSLRHCSARRIADAGGAAGDDRDLAGEIESVGNHHHLLRRWQARTRRRSSSARCSGVTTGVSAGRWSRISASFTRLIDWHRLAVAIVPAAVDAALLVAGGIEPVGHARIGQRNRPRRTARRRLTCAIMAVGAGDAVDILERVEIGIVELDVPVGALFGQVGLDDQRLVLLQLEDRRASRPASPGARIRIGSNTLKPTRSFTPFCMARIGFVLRAGNLRHLAGCAGGFPRARAAAWAAPDRGIRSKAPGRSRSASHSCG